MAIKVITKPKARLSYFKTTKAVLDIALSGVVETKGKTKDEIRQDMCKHLQHMSKQYFAGKKPDNNYDDPVCRLAYVYCYFPANANLCEIAIRRTPELTDMIKERLEDNGELKVLAFGGGPGTELLALAKHLTGSRSGPPVSISFTLLDYVEEWAETWVLVETQLKEFLKKNFGAVPNWPLMVSRTFIPFDVTSLKKFGNVRQLFGQDLYILNFVVSELFAQEELEGLNKVLSEMVRSAPNGSMVLVIDRNQKSIVSKSKALLKRAGLTIGDVQECNDNMDSDEESSDLGEHLLSAHKPRLRWNSFWIVGRKQ